MLGMDHWAPIQRRKRSPIEVFFNVSFLFRDFVIKRLYDLGLDPLI